MADDFIDLRSVNWSQGMFLTPDHFNRQERYVDSLMLWVSRYATASAGLVGGGPRVAPAERGATTFDPVVYVDDADDTLKVSVTQARGITPGGAIVEVGPTNALTLSVPRRDVDGAQDLGVYIVALPHEKGADTGIDDPINQQLQTARRAQYRLTLQPSADEATWCLEVARIRRADRGLHFERAGGFVPACATMSAHSELMVAFRRINERIAAIADRYSALHRAIVDFVAMARSRGLNIEQDLETLSFASRMVVVLEECAYRVLDPLQAPRQFFQETNQLIRSAALFLSLSPPTREYFRLLGEIGATEFVSMLEQEGAALDMSRRWSLGQDLGAEADAVITALDRLERLEQALEGKYMDFRVSPSLESINFVFDRTAGDPVLYRSVAKPTPPRAHGQELSFVFAPLRLEAREQYRLILVGDRQGRFDPGFNVTAELRVNHGEGLNRPPEFRTAQWEVDGQRNFAIDFSAPDDIISINDVRLSLRSNQPIRSALLYVRARLMPGGASYAPRAVDVPRPMPSRPVVAPPVQPPVRPVVTPPRPAPPAPPLSEPPRRKSRLSGDE